MRTKRTMMWLAALALAAASCGGSTSATTVADTTVPGGDGAVEDTTTIVTIPAATTTTLAEPSGSGLTLADFIPGFGGLFGSETTGAEFRELEWEAEEQIRECMAAEGFEYVPYIPGAVDGGMLGADLSDEEFARQYGYGLSTSILEIQELYESAEDLYDPSIDPNYAITEAMDEGELEEYQLALYGDFPDVDLDTMTDEEIDELIAGYQSTGCLDVAYGELYGGQNLLTELGDELEELYARVETDLRIVAAEHDWVSCMAGRGRAFADQDEILEYLLLRLDEVVVYPGGGTDAGSADPSGEGGEPATSDYVGPVYDEAEFQALMDEEIAIAVADWECATELRTLYDEYEAEFVNANLERLQELSQGS